MRLSHRLRSGKFGQMIARTCTNSIRAIGPGRRGFRVLITNHQNVANVALVILYSQAAISTLNSECSFSRKIVPFCIFGRILPVKVFHGDLILSFARPPIGFLS